MVVHTHSDASYITDPCSLIRAGGYYLLCTKNTYLTHINSPTLLHTQIIPTVIASITEGEIASLFINYLITKPLRNTLTKTGQPKPPAPTQTDNYVAEALVNRTINTRK